MEPVVIWVYKDSGVWRFDDRTHRITGEPLVFGMERLLDRLAERLPWPAEDGMELAISDTQIPNGHGALLREEEDAGGFWYYSKVYDLRGWMGSRALLSYFNSPPATLHFAARPPSAVGRSSS